MLATLRARFAEIVLVILLVLQILDFFKLLPGDLDFLKKIVSIVILVLLFYKVGFSWLMHGVRMPWWSDMLVLISYLGFVTKDLIAVAEGAEATLFSGVIDNLLFNAGTIELWGFYIGGVGLILASIYFATQKSHTNSLLGNLHVNKMTYLLRFFVIFLLLNAFFILVFDLFLEWLGIAVDSIVVVAILLGYLVFFVRRHKLYDTDTLIYKLGSTAENVEEKFLTFFHDKKRIYLGLTGLMVLHLLTDIGVFIFPYLFNQTESFYLLGQQSLYTQLALDMTLANPYIVSIAYLLNVVALVSLMILPAFLWYEVYKNKIKRIPKWFTGVLFGSILTFLLSSIWIFVPIQQAGLVGTNILIKSVVTPILSWVVVASIILGIVIFFVSFMPALKRMSYHIIIASTLVFMF